MPIIMNNCKFVDCAGGISAPDETVIQLNDTHFFGGGQAIDLYKPATLQSIGLPLDTPRDQLEELISELIAKHSASPEQKAEIVKRSRLGEVLSGAASFSTIAKNIVDLASKLSQ